MAQKASYAVPAVDRMLDILEFLSEHPEPYGVTDLSRALSINTNSIFRILRRLTERGYVELESESGGYQLSTRFFSLGLKLQGRFDLRRRARRELEALCAQSGETCQLQALSGKEMLVLDAASPQQPFYFHVVPGSRVQIHANAFGKASLAFLPEGEMKAHLPSKLPSLTAHTLTTRKALQAELVTARRDWIAYDREEYVEGITCLSAPLFDGEGAVLGGIGITGLTVRMKDRLDSLADQVRACGEAISRNMGYEDPYGPSSTGANHEQ